MFSYGKYDNIYDIFMLQSDPYVKVTFMLQPVLPHIKPKGVIYLFEVVFNIGTCKMHCFHIYKF